MIELFDGSKYKESPFCSWIEEILAFVDDEYNFLCSYMPDSKTYLPVGIKDNGDIGIAFVPKNTSPSEFKNTSNSRVIFHIKLYEKILQRKPGVIFTKEEIYQEYFI